MNQVRHGGNQPGRAKTSSSDTVQVILDAAIEHLPRILDSQDLFSGTSADFRRKLSAVLGPEYAQSVAQLTAQQLEAVAKKLEIGQRWALRVARVKAEYEAAPALVFGQVSTVQKIFEIRRAAALQSQGRVEEVAIVDAFIGKMLAELLNEGSPRNLVEAGEVARFLFNSHLHRLQASETFRAEIGALMAAGTTPSEIPFVEIYKKHFGSLPDLGQKKGQING